MYNLCVTSLHSHITLLNCNHYKFTLISHIPCYTYANTYYHSFLHYSLPFKFIYIINVPYIFLYYIPFLTPVLLHILISYSHNYIFHSLHICILSFVIFYFHIFSFYIFTHSSFHILSSHIYIFTYTLPFLIPYSYICSYCIIYSSYTHHMHMYSFC